MVVRQSTHAAAPTWLNVVRAIERFHAWAVRSVGRGNGAEFFREDAKERTVRPTMELKTPLRELLQDDDMGRPEMGRSRRFVSDIVSVIDFLKKASLTALSALSSKRFNKIRRFGTIAPSDGLARVSTTF